mgnify:CR=1 FL=1
MLFRSLPIELLIEQLQTAGVKKKLADDTVLTEKDKTQLLDYLRQSHGARSKVMTRPRPRVTELTRSGARDTISATDCRARLHATSASGTAITTVATAKAADDARTDGMSTPTLSRVPSNSARHPERVHRPSCRTDLSATATNGAMTNPAPSTAITAGNARSLIRSRTCRTPVSLVSPAVSPSRIRPTHSTASTVAVCTSASAVAVRIAVVPGRTVIGIELPNANRVTVYLREQLSSDEFEKSEAKLSLALGKDIGGAPVFADLARMPHLLVAGTTGSGKSVAINTMIMSLLYRNTQIGRAHV